MSRDSAVRITNRLGTGKSGQLLSIADRERDVFFLPQMSTPTPGPIQQHLQWVSEALYLGVKQPGREVGRLIMMSRFR
jgi:hypothetical protein